jgi:hypothetical protein
MINNNPKAYPLELKELFPRIVRGEGSQLRFRIVKRKTPSGVRTQLDIREYKATNTAAVFTQRGVYFSLEEIPFVISTLQKALEELRTNGSNVRNREQDSRDNKSKTKLV